MLIEAIKKVDRGRGLYPPFEVQLLFAAERFDWVFLRGDA